jgi:hypothetical protein
MGSLMLLVGIGVVVLFLVALARSESLNEPARIAVWVLAILAIAAATWFYMERKGKEVVDQAVKEMTGPRR